MLQEKVSCIALSFLQLVSGATDGVYLHFASVVKDAGTHIKFVFPSIVFHAEMQGKQKHLVLLSYLTHSDTF